MGLLVFVRHTYVEEEEVGSWKRGETELIWDSLYSMVKNHGPETMRWELMRDEMFLFSSHHRLA